MWPYTETENTWLREAGRLDGRLPSVDWPTQEMVDYYVRKGERLRAEVTARALSNFGHFIGRTARAAWHALADVFSGHAHRRSAT